MQINYPAQYNTATERVAYLQNLLGKMKVLFNRMGVWFNTGATLNQYNNLLPNLVKNRYAYAPQLSETLYKDFCGRWQHWNMHIHNELVQQKAIVQADNTIDCDIDRDFVE